MIEGEGMRPAQVEETPKVETQEWAKVELMGHRTRIGRIEAVTRFGTELLRVDFYDPDIEQQATEFYNGASIYCLSPVTREVVEAYEKVQRSYRRPSLRQLPPPEVDPDDPFALGGHLPDEDGMDENKVDQDATDEDARSSNLREDYDGL